MQLTVEWTELDEKAVNTVRALAMDAVQKVGNGHPGTAMSLAPAAYLLYQRFLRHDPADPAWLGRDRFVLSNGHTSLTQYIQLYLSGYGLELSDIESFRTWGSRTPGHPEYGHTVGIETTTGPLGQGYATAVGMAMDARYVRGLFDPVEEPGRSPFDHHVWVFAGDGCMQEGITSEAASLAGHQRLGNLIVIYDDNHISIEGNTEVSFSEDVLARHAAYGWHTQHVDLGVDGDVDIQSLATAMQNAMDEHGRPSIISLRTIIAWPAPDAQNTGAAHGSALGAEEVAETKTVMGMDPHQDFFVDPEVLERAREVKARGAQTHAEWNQRFQRWRSEHADKLPLLDRLLARQLPDRIADAVPEFDPAKPMATRKASGAVINAIAEVMPELWGGSADLAESNLTTIEGGGSFLPATSQAPGKTPYGRILHFGIREHAMGAILNGIALGGLTRPFGGTFLVFSDYMRGAVRIAALMQAPVTYVWTHDSIGLGEDGPTHQPVEHLTALRAIPGLDVVRPADPNETAACWLQVLRNRRPAALALTRQNVPTLPADSVADAARGGYVLADAEGGEPQVILIGTGSEVQLALEARTTLQTQGVPTRVVSMPCTEWFDEQSAEYRESVLPAAVRARVSVEAGRAMPWYKYVGTEGRCVSLEHFGASAAFQKLFEEFGITADAVVAAARDSLAQF
ncbi:MAG: transketolase [Candidatus Nanopelagicales bacterium]